MSGARIVIDRLGAGRSRAALVVRGRLEDLLIDPADADMPAPGAVWRGRVDRLVPQLGAAFLRLGGGQTGFLREAKGLREGEMLGVQAVSHPEEGKAVPVTRRLLFKTRTVIATPGAPGVNLSRQIRDGEVRARLAEQAADGLAGVAMPEGTGLILRSLAGTEAAERIAADIAEAAGIARAVAARLAERGEPALVLGAPDAAAVALRDWDGVPVPPDEGFAAHGLLEALDALASPLVELPSGGWIAVEPTRALVAVDVNTAGAFGADAGLAANLETARELARQLRLRGLGGMIVVDFAPLPKRDRRRVEDALKGSFRRDPIETSLAGWTPLGLFEIQRKRERLPTALLLTG